MGFLSRNSETAKLDQVVDSLPAQVGDWTPQQRAQYTTQSDRAMHEQATPARRRRRGRR